MSELYNSSLFSVLADLEADNWWFRSRNKIILWSIHKHITQFKTLLEIGCGTGYVMEGINRAYPELQMFGYEYFEEGMKYAQKRVPSASFSKMDARYLDEVECYDCIGAFDVIEHIEEDELVLENLSRALKPGGTLMLTVPQHPWLWSAVDERACHVRRYTRSDLSAKVLKHGLCVVCATSFVSILLPLMWLARLRARKENYDPMSEFRIPRWCNRILELVMTLELGLLKIGVRFPFGGSLLLLVRKL